MEINKDTTIYGSFSSSPGNNGCMFFNKAFHIHNINAIYKSFYSIDAQKVVESAKHLGFGGFALSMPLKIDIMKYIDDIDESALKIGAVNTVVNQNGKLVGYNTDWVGVSDYFMDAIDTLTILGNGGFSKAVQYTCLTKNIPFTVITRKDWGLVYDLDGYVFNATPIDIVTKGTLIDGRPTSTSGKAIAILQAKAQFKLYTGLDYE